MGTSQKTTSAGTRPPTTISWGPIAAIVVTLAAYICSQVIGSLVILSTGGLLGYTGDQLAQWVQQTVPQFLYIVAVEAAVLGILAVFLGARRATFKTLGLVKPLWKDLGWAGAGALAYFPLLILATVIIRLWIPSINLDQEQQIGFQAAHGFWPLTLVFISLAVLPPVTEEILARGFLYLGIKARFKQYIAALLTSIIFGVAHLQFWSGAPLLWSAAIDTFILSLVLIYIREKTNALWAPIGLHMLKNTIAFCVLFLFAK